MNGRILSLAIGLCAFATITISSTHASDWPRFRGPNGSGISTDQKPVPAQWSETENLKWKVALPGPGSSSPIVVRDRIFVTCWTGYGSDRRNPGNQEDLRRHLLCLDRETGKSLWSKAVEPVLPEDRYADMFAQHGYASHTPVSDGERVYVYFGKSGALAFDLDGKQLWQTKVGKELDPHHWGSASSPVLYKNLLIVTASAECEGMVGLDNMTGKEVWRQEASGLNGTWGTPVLVEVDAGRTDLVIGVPNEIWAFNPETGKLRWYCTAMNTDQQFCSSLVAEKGVVYGLERGGSIAVRVGGTGDVSKSHVVWEGRNTSRIGTPIVSEGRLYFFGNRVANCIDTKTGDEIFKARLGSDSATTAEAPRSAGPGGRGGGPMTNMDYASPIVADGKLYFLTRNGEMFVLKLGTTFEQLAQNKLTKDSEDFSATPAVSDGQLFIRSNKHLYCIAAGK